MALVCRVAGKSVCLLSKKSPQEKSSIIVTATDPVPQKTEVITIPLPQAAPAETAEQVGVVFDDLEGRPSLGPKEAPVTLVEFSDFHCPFCAKVSPLLEQLMKNYAGKIRRVWRHYPLAVHSGAGLTHEASECAHEQGRFWEYRDRLFATQGAWRDEAGLLNLAHELGFEAARFQACLSSHKYREVVQRDIAKGNQVGVNGTPTFFVNGKPLVGSQPFAHFEYMVENILNPGKVPMPPTMLPKPVEPPKDVPFDDLEGRPSLGPKNAAVTLVEFSDFHCPFCARVAPTLEQLMKNYAGKIRRVWRHYPLPFHAGAEKTHEASECAHEQGQFWQFHDKVFAAKGGPKDEAALLELAKGADLNQKKFKKCLESGRYTELVQKEIARGNESGVRGTPAVFVNGELISGAQPYEAFDQLVQKKLKQT